MLDDGGAYGVGMADAFAAQAVKKGMTVLIRDRLDPLNADYTAILTGRKALALRRCITAAIRWPAPRW